MSFSRVPGILFVCGMVAEISSVIVAGQVVGLFPTLVLIGLGIVGGISLLRKTGGSLAGALGEPIRISRTALDLGVRSIFSVLAAGLLIMPGFVSDLLALLLLMQPIQKLVQQTLRSQPAGGGGRPTAARERHITIIEARAVGVEIQEDPAAADR